jgi:sortase (surface protein transpeptidase)
MKKFVHTSYIHLAVLILAFVLTPVLGAHADTTYASLPSAPTTDAPAFVYIPSISLFSSVLGVGVNEKGNMDVPSGLTNDVGWYKYGTLPGDTGTAVLDAHNTAAFKFLHLVPPGGDIYILTTRGHMMHFKVTKAVTYSMEVLKPQTLFAYTDKKQINLITCAGTLLGNGEATHRLIVSAELV